MPNQLKRMLDSSLYEDIIWSSDHKFWVNDQNLENIGNFD